MPPLRRHASTWTLGIEAAQVHIPVWFHSFHVERKKQRPRETETGRQRQHRGTAVIPSKGSDDCNPPAMARVVCHQAPSGIDSEGMFAEFPSIRPKERGGMCLKRCSSLSQACVAIKERSGQCGPQVQLGLQASVVSGAANIAPSALPPQMQSWGQRGGVPRRAGWKPGAKGLGMLSPCPGRPGART